MALQSRRSKHFQPAKLTEWTSGKEIFFIHCRKRTSGSQRNDSYLCVQKLSQAKTPAKNAKSDNFTKRPLGNSSQDKFVPLEGMASDSSQNKDDQLAQDNDDQSKESKATQSHDDEPEEEATQTSRGKDDQAEGKSSQGNIEQAEEKATQTSHDEDDQAKGKSSQEKTKQAGETATQTSHDKDEEIPSQGIIELAEEKISHESSDNENDEYPFDLPLVHGGRHKKHERDLIEISYSVRCEPSINKHNDEDTFMLFRLLKPKRKEGMYLVIDSFMYNYINSIQ